MSSVVHQNLSVLICFALLLAFLVAPGIDLEVSRRFYSQEQGFILRNLAIVQWVHLEIPHVATLAVVGLLTVLLLGFLPVLRRFRGMRRPATYALLVLALGPGLVVNGLFKAHSGRARPVDVVEFGGDRSFTAAAVFADQCRRNCSFVSGHAAFGFSLCVLGFLTRRRRWFVLAILVGALLGAARIVHGRHFLSDVVFAFFSVYFSAKFFYFLLYSAASPLFRLGRGAPAPTTLAQPHLRGSYQAERAA